MTSLNQLIAAWGTLSLASRVLYKSPSCPHLKLLDLDCLNFLITLELGKQADFSFLFSISIPQTSIDTFTVALR